VPGTPGLMHRVGGLEKEDGSGNVSYDAENHDTMTRIRDAKIAGIAKDIPPVNLDDQEGADFLVLTWGGTWGAASAAVSRVRSRGKLVAHAHLRHMNPFPADLGDVVRRFSQILVPEINLGQLSKLVRAEFLVDARSYGKMYGVPFHAADLEMQILEMMKS
jgi:2-oxoglutarate ferredoxin oxidoreductase subunit alpha